MIMYGDERDCPPCSDGWDEDEEYDDYAEQVEADKYDERRDDKY